MRTLLVKLLLNEADEHRHGKVPPLSSPTQKARQRGHAASIAWPTPHARRTRWRFSSAFRVLPDAPVHGASLRLHGDAMNYRLIALLGFAWTVPLAAQSGGAFQLTWSSV